MHQQAGRIIIYTGNGKGKTTAALGEGLRFWGEGKKVLILQFIKGVKVYGEFIAAGKMGADFTIKQMGLGFVRFATKDTIEQHRAAACQALQKAKEHMISGNYDLIILDEILYSIKFGLIDKLEVIELIKIKPEKLEIVLTGRDAPEELTNMADIAIEVREVKHHLRQGILAQKGIEF
ncbi:cob(I)alamin adenosyltransferase [Desulfotomaculum arcticum]|uniref:Cob(I)alamin adenosyltransferase n=1 Tax=Desulfotruncus arcticus DSM 17038 TaxID=1121424 RepID=A0A1I2Q8P3_9FIRM|nr:cob(I)alamin adenosyltransferase [Desulfotomaculum arcticum] [Desulfotruncus arcticus DSM 17038]